MSGGINRLFGSLVNSGSEARLVLFFVIFGLKKRKFNYFSSREVVLFVEISFTNKELSLFVIISFASIPLTLEGFKKSLFVIGHANCIVIVMIIKILFSIFMIKTCIPI